MLCYVQTCNDANLRNADLQYTYLQGANLRDADLKNANLSYAKLKDINLDDANLEGIQHTEQPEILAVLQRRNHSSIIKEKS